MIAIATYEMGLAVKVPHIRDEGHFWVRKIITFTPEGGELLTGPLEGKKVRVRLQFEPKDIQNICENIFESLIDIYSTPVQLAMTDGQGRIGFTIPDSQQRGDAGSI